MIPLVVMAIALATFRTLGVLRYDSLDSWAVALRYALAVMFLFTGTMHFTRTRTALIRMVPPWSPVRRSSSPSRACSNWRERSASSSPDWTGSPRTR